MQVRFLPTGDTSVTVEFGNKISPAINQQIRAFNLSIVAKKIPGIIETVPTYCSLLIHYMPETILYDEMVSKLEILLNEISDLPIPPSSVIEIPVYYGGESGPDLEFVAAHNGLKEEEVVQIHSEKEYLIYMQGFIPGFSYLGGMDERIAAPRLEKPRMNVPAGSVGIAGTQTGATTVDTPSGWRFIGHTPVRLYDSAWEKPSLVDAGDYMKFFPITKREYDAIAQQVAAGTYICTKRPHKEEK